MQAHSLSVQKRTLIGRKVKKLRKDGILPANIFGKKIASLAVQVDRKAFGKVYKETGETGIVELAIGDENKKRPVLITNVTRHPLSGLLLHADFHQVDLSEKVTARVRLAVQGEAPAVIQKVGALLTPVDEVEVSALPMDLPEHIMVDVTTLAELDQEIKVKDLKVDSAKYTLLTDPELVIAKIGPLVTKEAEELAKEQAAQAAEAAAAAAPAAEAPVAEGEKPSEAPVAPTDTKAATPEKKPEEAKK